MHPALEACAMVRSDTQGPTGFFRGREPKKVEEMSASKRYLYERQIETLRAEAREWERLYKEATQRYDNLKALIVEAGISEAWLIANREVHRVPILPNCFVEFGDASWQEFIDFAFSRCEMSEASKNYTKQIIDRARRYLESTNDGRLVARWYNDKKCMELADDKTGLLIYMYQLNP